MRNLKEYFDGILSNYGTIYGVTCSTRTTTNGHVHRNIVVLVIVEGKPIDVSLEIARFCGFRRTKNGHVIVSGDINDIASLLAFKLGFHSLVGINL